MINGVKHSFIYKTTNLINGKIYIGQHTTNNVKDDYLGSGIILFNAIKKYGKENFKREILEHCLPCRFYLNNKEIEWIKKLDSKNKEIGYNITSGGGGVLGYITSKEHRDKVSKANKGLKRSDEVKRKMSEQRRGKNAPNFGKKFSEEAKRKMSEAQKGKHLGEKNHFFGKKHSKESLKKMSESSKGQIVSKETIEKLRIIRTGRRNSIKTIEKMSESAKNRDTVTCPYCNKIGNISTMKRYHFDNCRLNPSNDTKKVDKKRKQKVVTCPHCGKKGGNRAMKQWHFDNCRHKEKKQQYE